MLAVVDVDVELALDGVVHDHASLNVELVVLVVPVGLERDRHAFPAVRVAGTEAVTATSDDALVNQLLNKAQME